MAALFIIFVCAPAALASKWALNLLVHERLLGITGQRAKESTKDRAEMVYRLIMQFIGKLNFGAFAAIETVIGALLRLVVDFFLLYTDLSRLLGARYAASRSHLALKVVAHCEVVFRCFLWSQQRIQDDTLCCRISLSMESFFHAAPQPS